jgi:hypothetical protein
MSHRRALAWIALALVVGGVALVRWRLRDMPLERDEGEYAYMGRLVLDGVPPYREAGNHKFPGTYLAYAGIMAAFGETPAGIRTGFTLVNAATIVAVFLVGRRISGDVGAVTAAASYAVLSLGSGVLGLAAHLTQFAMLPLAVGLALLVHARGMGWIVAAGLCMGLAVVVRQTSLAFVALGAAWVAMAAPRRAPVARTVAFLVASVIPVLAMAGWLWRAGVFPEFWRWTVTQAITYGSQTALADGLVSFRTSAAEVVWPAALLWCGAGVGIACALVRRDEHAVLLLGLLLASAATVASGLLFRTHYYVQMLPAVALLLGYGAAVLWRRGPVVVLLVVVVALLGAVRSDADVFFTLAPDAVARRLYGVNPFPESPVIARYLHEHTQPSDRIAILGSEPQILFLADRRAATDVLYTYPLVEVQPGAHALQEKTAHEIEAARPAYVAFVTIATSWLVREQSDLWIFQWAKQFLADGYRLDGVVEILPDGTQWAWGDAAATYRPTTANTVRLFRRRDLDAG